MLEVPGGETAVVRIVSKLDLAFFQRVTIGGAKDREQHAGARSERQDVPIDVKRRRMRGRWSPFQQAEPPRIVGEMHTDMVRNEIENETEVVRLQRLAQAREATFT